MVVVVVMVMAVMTRWLWWYVMLPTRRYTQVVCHVTQEVYPRGMDVTQEV